jgi:hypothetical protein
MVEPRDRKFGIAHNGVAPSCDAAVSRLNRSDVHVHDAHIMHGNLQALRHHAAAD